MFTNFTQTKILTTIGPATDSSDKMRSLINAGITAVRFNFSHIEHDYFSNTLSKIEKICGETSTYISVLIDLQGPKIRVGELEKDEIELKSDDTIEITTDDIKGTKEIISTSYKNLPNEASPGDKILLDDGLINLVVKKIKDKSVVCEIIEGGVLKPRKGMNLPGMKLSIPSLTSKDYSDLEFALKHRVDFVALSFVRKADDIIELRNWMKKNGYDKPIIAKIEKPEAVENFDEILEATDGIMVARGDLGVEMDPQEVPVIQKNIIHKCKEAGKLVITATQMLESMIHNPIPTRAEASDVANAVWDGTDVVMLSAETSVGKYPIEAVRMMKKILLSTESQPHLNAKIDHKIPEGIEDNIFDSTGRAAVLMMRQVKPAIIVIFTHYGRKAKIISKFKPRIPIVAISDRQETLYNLNMHYGTIPFQMNKFDVPQTAITNAVQLLKEKQLINKGDLVMFAAGAPHTDDDRQSWTQFVII